MSAEVTPIDQDEPEGQLADVIELRPDGRTFLERHKRTIRNAVLGVALGTAAIAGAIEAYDWVTDYVDARNQEIGRDFRELFRQSTE